MVEETYNWLAMSEFVQRWKEAGSPINRDWYETFMKYTCLNTEHPKACFDDYCPMGEIECSRLINEFS